MRVFPSSSTVTTRGPFRISATSTKTGLGQRVQASAPKRPMTPRTIRERFIKSGGGKRIGMFLVPGFQDGDEVEPIDAPADDEGRSRGRRKHDEGRLGVGGVLDDERYAVEVAGERFDQKP